MNNIVRSRGSMPIPGQRDGNWIWNGSGWVCDPDCGDGDGSLPPFGPPVFSGPVNQPPWYPGANGGVSFGAMAPPNPVRGHLWWNGTTFFLFDGAAWVPIGGAQGGSVTPPSSTAPLNPVPGQQWFNGSTLFVWDGNAWIPTATTKTFIQPTAPPTPNAGDMWWDGTQMRIWDGTAWELVGPGATVGPVPTTTVEFAITCPTSLTLPGAGAWGIIPFSASPQLDTFNAYNSSTHKYTPTRPGVYSALLRGYPGTASGAVAVVKNDPGTFTGLASSDIIIGIASSTSGQWQSAEGLVQMNGTTDFIRAWARSDAGTFPATASNPCFIITALP